MNNLPAVLGRPARPSTWLLACDDGANEIADFIHFDLDTLTLSFVHVKSTKSMHKQRSFSVGEYEQVLVQALKNLIATDVAGLVLLMRARLKSGTAMLNWSWDGTRPKRQAVIDALEESGQRIKREVIVLQPRTLRSAWRHRARRPNPNKPALASRGGSGSSALRSSTFKKPVGTWASRSG